MPLSDDQKAMLRVLSQREEGYEDMAALMGISVEELRRRVKEALAEVEEDEAANEPAPPAPPPPAKAPEEPATAQVPPAPTPPPTPASTPTQKPQRLPSPKLPKDRGALIGIGLGVLAIAAMAIVLAVSGSSSSSSTSSESEGETASLVEAVSRNPNLTDAILTPAPGGEGEGVAIFGRVKKAVVLEVAAKGLEPSEAGQSYAVWLSHAGKAMVPMGTAKVLESGELGARLEVPPAVLVLVAKRAFTQVDVTRVIDSQLKAAVATARKQKAESAYTGTPVLRGQINGPLISAAGKHGG